MIAAVVLSLIVLALAPGATAAQDDLPARVREVRESVVTVLAFGRDGRGRSQGTGFFVEPHGHLVTNRHVLEGASSAEVVQSVGAVHAIDEVLAEDEVADLVVVRVRPAASAFPALRLAVAPPAVVESVFVVGAPLGQEATVSTGIVATVRQLTVANSMIQITAPISPGSSGSPALDVFGFDCMRASDGRERLCSSAAGERATEGFVTGAVVGGFLGWAIGQSIRFDRWEPVPVNRLRR